MATNLNAIRAGEKLSTTMYMEVISVNRKDSSIQVKNSLTGQEFTIKGEQMISGLSSSQQYSDIVKVTRTELAEILSNKIGDGVFTVHFIKQDGSERTMVCYKLETENYMGRLNVYDLEETAKYRIKQVDLRTAKWVIYNGTKYEVKK